MELECGGGRVANMRRVFHSDLLGRTLAWRQFVRAFVFHAVPGVPDQMKREDQPILIVDETRIDIFLDVVRLAAELRTYVCNLHRIACLVFPLIGDAVGFGLPGPRPGEFESGNVYVEGVADRLDLSPRIDTIRLRDFFADSLPPPRPRTRRTDPHPESQKIDHH